MQLITTMVEPFTVDRLTRALRKAAVPTYTMTEAKVYTGEDGGGDLAPKIKIELAVEDNQVLALIDLIRETVSSHQESDGIIFVSELRHVVGIKSGRTGSDALTFTPKG